MRHSLRPSLVALSCLGALLSASASASDITDCANGDAPGPYTTATCDAGLSIPICAEGSGLLLCDININIGFGFAGEGYLITEYNGTGPDFTAFGTTPDGYTFCCNIETDANEVDTIELRGSNLDDTLAFSWSASEYLTQPSSYATAALMTYIYGEGGADTIDGSYETVYAIDHLHGEGGADTISGHDGQDYIYGGDGDDDLLGGVGTDHIYGGDGDDGLRGNQGTDRLYGGTGADAICGGNGADELYGEGGNDELWGGAGSDQADGGSGFLGDACFAESETACESTLREAPAGCP